MTEDIIKKRLPISLAVAVFAVLLVTVVTTTSIHAAYADDDCKGKGCDDDGGDGDNCIINALGISVCDSVESTSTK